MWLHSPKWDKEPKKNDLVYALELKLQILASHFTSSPHPLFSPLKNRSKSGRMSHLRSKSFGEEQLEHLKMPNSPLGIM